MKGQDSELLLYAIEDNKVLLMIIKKNKQRNTMTLIIYA